MDHPEDRVVGGIGSIHVPDVTRITVHLQHILHLHLHLLRGLLVKPTEAMATLLEEVAKEEGMEDTIVGMVVMIVGMEGTIITMITTITMAVEGVVVEVVEDMEELLPLAMANKECNQPHIIIQVAPMTISWNVPITS